jgi:hypothetical protein
MSLSRAPSGRLLFAKVSVFFGSVTRRPPRVRRRRSGTLRGSPIAQQYNAPITEALRSCDRGHNQCKCVPRRFDAKEGCGRCQRPRLVIRRRRAAVAGGREPWTIPRGPRSPILRSSGTAVASGRGQHMRDETKFIGKPIRLPQCLRFVDWGKSFGLCGSSGSSGANGATTKRLARSSTTSSRRQTLHR